LDVEPSGSDDPLADSLSAYGNRAVIRRIVYALVLAAFIAPHAVRAQRDASAPPRATASTADLKSAPRTAALVAEAVPRGLVTVVVPVPLELRDAENVSFDVHETGDAEVLGRMHGQATTQGVTRPLVLTVRVPAGADAGSIDAAAVLFRAADGREYVVPVVIRVTAVRNVVLTGPSEMRGLRNGDRVELAYRLFNAGNAVDTLQVEVIGPLGWTVRLARSPLVVVDARRPLPLIVHLSVPPTANVGDHPLTISLRRPTQADAAATVFTALGITGRAGEITGLVVRSTIASASTSRGQTTFTSAALDGPVSANAFLRAHVSTDVSGDGLTMQGLGAVGAMSAPVSASLYGRRWDVTAGTTGLELSPLTGVSLAGEGATARFSTDLWDFRSIAARPAIGVDARGELVGAGYWRARPFGRVGFSASYLSERGSFARGRELTSGGFDYMSTTTGPLVFAGSVAYRESDAGTGVGFGADVGHSSELGRASARYMHAPGGSAAFARAVDEWQIDLARNITPRWSVDASASNTHDAGNVFDAMDVSSWSLGHRWIASRGTTLTLRGQSSKFDADAAAAAIGDFGASERSLTGGLDWINGVFAVNVEGSMGSVERITELSDGSVDRAIAARRSMDASATRSTTRWGTFEARAGLELTESGVGVPGQVWNAAARLRGLPFSVFDQQFRLNTEASYQRLGKLQTAVVTRATLQMALPGGFELALAAERNPFFRTAEGDPGWVGAVRLTAATRVFSPKALGPQGEVFEDRNQNGRRDAGEPGVAGVVVRRGETRAVTNAQGIFRLPTRARGRTTIEQSSLPLGLLAHPGLATDTVERLDLPVLPTGSVTIELELLADPDGRVPDVNLAPAIVILRDASGFEWVARRTGASTAVFDGVPVGQYDLRFDFSRLREPLRAQDTVKVIVAPHEQQTIKIPLRGRAVRLFDSGRDSRSPNSARREDQQR
jgi:hypothetical protein